MNSLEHKFLDTFDNYFIQINTVSNKNVAALDPRHSLDNELMELFSTSTLSKAIDLCAVSSGLGAGARGNEACLNLPNWFPVAMLVYKLSRTCFFTFKSSNGMDLC